MTDWLPSGVITITTDFGHKGPFAAVMTGVITTTMQVGKLHETYRQLDAVRKELVQLIQNHQQNGNLVLSQDPLLPVMAKQTPFILSLIHI